MNIEIAWAAFLASALTIFFILFRNPEGFWKWLDGFLDDTLGQEDPPCSSGSEEQGSRKLPPRITMAESLERRAIRMAKINNISVERARAILQYLLSQAPEMDNKGKRKKSPIGIGTKRKERKR